MSTLGRMFGQQKSKDSRETLAKELLTKDNLITKTEIPRPAAMSILDTLVMMLSPTAERVKLLRDVNPDAKLDTLLSDLTPGNILGHFAYWMRVNYISKDRQSRKEFVDALRQVEFEEPARRRIEHLFGMHSED